MKWPGYTHAAFIVADMELLLSRLQEWGVEITEGPMIVDPGEAVSVSSYLQEAGLRLVAILLTHHHHDHVGGVDLLIRLQAAATPGGEKAAVYGPMGNNIPSVTQGVLEGTVIACNRGELTFSVLAVPGHTLDHLVYVAQEAGAVEAPHLFCGDTQWRYLPRCAPCVIRSSQVKACAAEALARCDEPLVCADGSYREPHFRRSYGLRRFRAPAPIALNEPYAAVNAWPCQPSTPAPRRNHAAPSPH